MCPAAPLSRTFISIFSRADAIITTHTVPIPYSISTGSVKVHTYILSSHTAERYGTHTTYAKVIWEPIRGRRQHIWQRRMTLITA